MLHFQVADRTTTAFRRDTRAQRAYFSTVRREESRYSAQLRKISRHIGDLIKAFPFGDLRVNAALQAYSKALRPWAEVQAKAMVVNVARRDESAWAQLSKSMSRALRREVQQAPTGLAMQALMAEQVHYITSLPLDAAERVHKLTIERLGSGEGRAEDIAEMIMNSGQVSQARANLIARTEVARTASTLVQARSEFIGSEGYLWTAVMDTDTRKEHRKLDGTYHRWDTPPVAGPNNMRYHAGAGPNCRCYPTPVLPSEY